jgi:para-aminobenzoate synthetase component 1
MTTTRLPLVEELSSSLTVMDAVRCLAHWPRLLLLESALQREPVGRFSFLMADPINHWTLAVPCYGTDPLAVLRSVSEQWAEESQSDLPPFQGGVAGLLGYELGQSWERVATSGHDEFQLPVMAVGLYDCVIAWDHQTNRVWLISQGWPESDLLARTDRAARRIRSVKQSLDANLVERPPFLCNQLPEIAPQFSLASHPQVTSSFSRENYLRTVERVIEYIDAGDIFQANLSQRLLTRAISAPSELYGRLRMVNPAPFAGLMQWEDWSIVSASPERFLSVTNGEIETRPIKGTRQRKRGPEADLFTRDELRQSEKDRAENVMIVDLLRNDLSRVCLPGTVRVPQLCAVESYETVQHLVSEVRGHLDPQYTIWDLFRATFPGGSISGAPKVRAMQIIAELEPTVRGPYCGSLFYVGADGKSDSNLLIRSFVQRYGWLQCHVGGGIVAQSNPEAEYEETLTKAAGMLRALTKNES